MRTINTLDVKWATWRDEGEYPNALASRPLPSREYPEAITGKLVVELDPHEELLVRDELVEIADDACAETCNARVTKWNLCWNWEHGKRRATLTVEEFDPDSVEPQDHVTFED
jgi:hypothetical protein